MAGSCAPRAPQVGDALVLTGGIANEGAAILASEHRELLIARGVSPAVVDTAADWLREPGISILPAAKALNATGAVHAMHDPTEGGLITALYELARRQSRTTDRRDRDYDSASLQRDLRSARTGAAGAARLGRALGGAGTTGRSGCYGPALWLRDFLSAYR